MTRVPNTSKPKHSAGCFHAIFALTRKRLAVKYCLNQDLLSSHGCKLCRVLQSDHTRCVSNKIEFCAQLIFRKVADVRREKELAERRKNEPQLDQAQDHLVRKIFSR